MSYTEYMNRKKAAAPVILDVRPKMDASTFTRHQRVTAAANVYAPTKSVVGNIFDMRTSAGRDNNYVRPGVQVTVATGQGGRVPDGSTFSDYAAGVAADMDYKNGPIIGRVLMNSNDATSIRKCNPAIAEPSSTISGAFAANNVPKTASQLTRDRIACYERQGEPHTDRNTPLQRGVTQFIDDTISLNSGTFRTGTGNHKTTGSTVQSSNGLTNGCPPGIHSYPAIAPRAAWAPRPTKGAGGLIVPSLTPVDQRKVGAAIARPKYVERHHGNDFGVNPRRVPTEYQIPAGAPAHLKINDTLRTV
jgi:hypothetical protein